MLPTGVAKLFSTLDNGSFLGVNFLGGRLVSHRFPRKSAFFKTS